VWPLQCGTLLQVNTDVSSTTYRKNDKHEESYALVKGRDVRTHQGHRKRKQTALLEVRVYRMREAIGGSRLPAEGGEGKMPMPAAPQSWSCKARPHDAGIQELAVDEGAMPPRQELRRC